jgi:hypothetical protein
MIADDLHCLSTGDPANCSCHADRVIIPRNHLVKSSSGSFFKKMNKNQSFPLLYGKNIDGYFTVAGALMICFMVICQGVRL